MLVGVTVNSAGVLLFGGRTAGPADERAGRRSVGSVLQYGPLCTFEDVLDVFDGHFGGVGYNVEVLTMDHCSGDGFFEVEGRGVQFKFERLLIGSRYTDAVKIVVHLRLDSGRVS
ncbi:hypothetical protein D6T63_15955 [Arthrobacter cheniae]|uniref:Uncharacterized protein n=1 Tax=Arthrobacter cheniae TaxID=1258888 RepID=A0A3A5M3S5_9MICC|nr:hypothetical protein D6T63_15955 [Arthrobacter cheniae]